MLEVVIEKDRIRVGQRFAVSFQRTLRIPDDGRTYPLPPGLGMFPIFRISDYRDRVPSLWREHGGAFIPMYQREALWLGFSAAYWKPNAVKIALGAVNSISGKPDRAGLHADSQDYLVCPEQPWLDGFNTGQGSIRQFLAMPLGLGYTVESSISGSETWGGIQITVFEPRPGRFADTAPVRSDAGPLRFASVMPDQTGRMGLGAGGLISQKIYPDRYGLETWDQNNHGQVFVHIVNSLHFREITGAEPPPTPIEAKTYTEVGLPWFELYDEAEGDVMASADLASAKTVAERDAELGEAPRESDSFEVPETQVKKVDRGRQKRRR